MHLLDRIDQALDRSKIDSDEFERFAVDSLVEVYPGIALVPRGTDWGRDADIPVLNGTSVPLAVTTARTRAGVAANIRRSIRSLVAHGRVPTRLVVATLAELGGIDRGSLEKTALRLGVSIDNFYDRHHFALALRRDGEWRSRLLGVPGDPISVSRLPADLHDSKWGQLPLVGRTAEVEWITSAPGDLLLSGLPGTGKSRLLAEVPNCLFIDRDSRFEVIADDLRRLSPDCVVVDDAGSQLTLIRQLRELRRQESDLVDYRIVVSCWPDEHDDVRDTVATDATLKLDLLERTAIDELLQEMGVHSLVARVEILHQAEGRVGWAIALADVLLTQRDSEGLRTGRVLFEQATRYFRRRALPDAALDTLATVALVGQLADDEIPTLAEHVGISKSEVVQHLRSCSHSGFNDVQVQRSSRSDVRFHRVRPPMLADALVADRFFGQEIPPASASVLFEQWQGREVVIAETTIAAALLGAASARTLSRTLLDQLIDSGASKSRSIVRVARSYGHLGTSEGEYVLRRLRPAFDAALSSERSNWDLSPYIDLAATLARWRLPQAITWLLDAALRQPDGRNPDGAPLRALKELCTGFHPERSEDTEIPVLVASTANEWIVGYADDEQAWDVWSKAARAALSLRRSGAFSDPSGVRTFSIYETVASPQSLRLMSERVWPGLAARLSDATISAKKEILDGIVGWLRIGAGYDRPFGKPHEPEVISAATQHGAKLLEAFAAVHAGSIGLDAAVSRIGKKFGLEVGTVDAALAPFLCEVSPAEDWEAEVQALRDHIERAISGWVREDPRSVCERLQMLRSELALVDVRWPARIPIACAVLATRVDDTGVWLNAALRTGLFPDADVFLAEHLRRGKLLDGDFVASALLDRQSRSTLVHHVLGAAESSEPAVNTVVSALAGSDHQVLKWLAYLELPEERVRRLLTEPPLAARAAFAMAMAHRLHGDERWSPGEFTDEWLAALDGIWEVPGAADHDVQVVARYLAELFPERLCELVVQKLTRKTSTATDHWHLTHALVNALGDLPSHAKSDLLRAGAGTDWRDGFLDGLVNEEVTWLEQALDEGLLSVKEAIHACARSERRPPLREMARVFRSRGGRSESIVAIVESGGWSGDESERYDRFVKDFGALAADVDPDVAEVGQLGVDVYLKAAETARQSERRERVFGFR